MSGLSNWDEQWACPKGHSSMAMGNGQRGGGSTVVTFQAPPRCYCGREMEQTTAFPVEPPAAPTR